MGALLVRSSCCGAIVGVGAVEGGSRSRQPSFSGFIPAHISSLMIKLSGDVDSSLLFTLMNSSAGYMGSMPLTSHRLIPNTTSRPSQSWNGAVTIPLQDMHFRTSSPMSP